VITQALIVSRFFTFPSWFVVGFDHFDYKKSTIFLSRDILKYDRGLAGL